MTSTDEKVSVIVPVYNGKAEGLLDNLTSLSKQTYRNMEVVMIDDCSSDGSATILENFRSKFGWKILTHDRNRGLAATLNDGLRLSSGEYLMILQQDCSLLTSGSIERSITHLRENGNIDILIGRQRYDFLSLNFYQKFSEFRFGHLFLHSQDSGRVDVTEIKCDIVRKVAMDKIALFDESLKFSGEDQIFSEKARKLGFSMYTSDVLEYRNSLKGEDSLGKVLKKDFRYGKYSAPLYARTYSTSKKRKSNDRYLRYKLLNRELTVLTPILIALSLLFFGLWRQVVFLFPVPFVVTIRALYVTKNLRYLKQVISSLELSLAKTILITLLCDFVYATGFAEGFVLYKILGKI